MEKDDKSKVSGTGEAAANIHEHFELPESNDFIIDREDMKNLLNKYGDENTTIPFTDIADITDIEYNELYDEYINFEYDDSNDRLVFGFGTDKDFVDYSFSIDLVDGSYINNITELIAILTNKLETPIKDNENIKFSSDGFNYTIKELRGYSLDTLESYLPFKINITLKEDK